MRSRTAAVTVETALVLPIALLFILGIFEYGRYLMTMQLMNNAAREGVRYAVTHLQPVTLGATTYGNATSDVTLGAAFQGGTPPKQHHLSVVLDGSGSVVSDPGGIDCPARCDADFTDGTSVTLAALK